MTSRIDTLQAPSGARRAPVLAFLTVAAVAALMVVVGLSEWGWLVAMFVPALALTTYVLVNTLWALRQGVGPGQEEGEEE